MSDDWTLPDPHYQPGFYADVAMKRLFAFIVDTVLLILATLLFALLSFGIGFFLLIPLWLAMNLAYRTIALARWSATPGMMLFAIEFRDARGHRFDQAAAFQHSLGFVFSWMFPPVQLVSAILMATGERGQGLTDLVLGSVAINRPANRSANR